MLNPYTYQKYPIYDGSYSEYRDINGIGINVRNYELIQKHICVALDCLKCCEHSEIAVSLAQVTQIFEFGYYPIIYDALIELIKSNYVMVRRDPERNCTCYALTFKGIYFVYLVKKINHDRGNNL